MADEMADSLNKLKLTSEEEEIIAISDEGRLEVLESCTLSLIEKFLTCKPFNKMAAKNTIRRAWGVDDAMQILEVGSNLFQFKFHSEFEMDRILRGGPWSFDNQLLMLQQWKKGMNVGNIKMENDSLWVQIWGAPLDMISPHVAKQLEVVWVKWKRLNGKRKGIRSIFSCVLGWPYQSRSLFREEGSSLGRMVNVFGWIINTRDYPSFAIFVGFWGMISRTMLPIMQQRRTVELGNTSMESFSEQQGDVQGVQPGSQLVLLSAQQKVQ
ncbi:hypothetical protein SO802_017762 [Lithocarpus litseifolius]|uniref:DUF4283 domain-containing protein n=1 Tax=Lithocarpus litseifolius TaxID=425828 RepID=A0AAW2CLV9_9ROSI